MSTEEQYGNHTRNLYDECRRHMYHHVTLTMTDGHSFDGIIESVNPDSITVLAGEDVMDREGGNESDSRQYYYGGFVPPRRRFRRFRRREFPLATLAALALLPYILPPTPYPYPYYPYY